MSDDIQRRIASKFLKAPTVKNHPNRCLGCRKPSKLIFHGPECRELYRQRFAR